MVVVLSQPPTFQFYVADFLASTADMDPAEVGAYLRLLCFQWEHGSVPDDDRKIARIIGSSGRVGYALWRSIKHKFSVSLSRGRLQNARLEKVRAQQVKRAALGRKGGHAKADQGGRKSEPDPPSQTPSKRLAKGLVNGCTPISDLRSPISDLRSSDRTSTDRGTREEGSCTDERTTGAAPRAGDSTSINATLPPPSSANQDDADQAVPVQAVVRDREGASRAEPCTAQPVDGMEGIDQGAGDESGLSEPDDGARLEGDGRGGARAFEATPALVAVSPPNQSDPVGIAALAPALFAARNIDEMRAGIRQLTEKRPRGGSHV
jgi:uncharacterized protein YdaU (DUF1376 family)